MAFATATDVATRLGRDLTDAEETQAEYVIGITEGLIADAVSKDAAWVAALSPVPEALELICVEKAIHAIANPTGVATDSETIGSYSYSQTFPRSADSGISLTEDEARRARFAVYATNRASVMAGSIFEEPE